MARDSGAAEESVRKTILRIKADQRQKLKDEQLLSIDYFKNRMVDHVEQELLDRFPKSQYGPDGGQNIYPVTLPLTERYVAEQATAYNRAVRRRFLDDEGKESDATREQTKKVNKSAARLRYDEVLHANDQFTVLNKTQCLLPDVVDRELRLTTHFTHNVFPVVPSGRAIDVSQPDDYDGFVVEMSPDQEDVTRAGGKMFVLLTDEERVFYRGHGPDTLDTYLYSEPNDVSFVRRESGETVDKPGRMLTFWYTALTPDELIVQADATVARMNHELNILYSVVLDTLRFQGHATPVITTTSKNKVPAQMAHGARFPAVVGAGEDFRYENASVPYSEEIKVLQETAQFFMLLLRSSPSDFAIEGQTAASGFAKLVDSLPRLEAREERLRALTWLEEYELSPRVVGALVEIGDLDPEAKKMRLVTEFQDIEFPLTIDERAKELEMDLQHNLTTPAKVLAKQKGISLEQAEEEIVENTEKNKAAKPEPPGVSLSALIGQRKKGANGEQGPGDGSPSFANRQTRGVDRPEPDTR